MESKQEAYVLANYGGPRNLEEVGNFLRAILTDPDVVQTSIPGPIQRWLFSRIAKKKTPSSQKAYEKIGGSSPIAPLTDELASSLHKLMGQPVLPFHRYLEPSHSSFCASLEEIDANEIIVFPLFPQFSYASTGSCARWFSKHLSRKTRSKLRWLKSYPSHPAFIEALGKSIQSFLLQKKLGENDCSFIYLSHGLPEKFVSKGDPYRDECEQTVSQLKKLFPGVPSQMGYQCKPGPGDWLKPYARDLCSNYSEWGEGRKNLIFIPLTFTTDSLETLGTIDFDLLPLVPEGVCAHRLPALNTQESWVQAIPKILSKASLCKNKELIR